jgi:hypothetical protein
MIFKNNLCFSLFVGFSFKNVAVLAEGSCVGKEEKVGRLGNLIGS